MTSSLVLPADLRLEELTVALQPVMELRTGRVHGFEAFLRGRDGCDIRPKELLRRARREHWLEDLEERAQTLAMQAADRFLQDGEILFLNIESRIPPAARRFPHLALEISESTGVHRELLDQLHAAHLDLYLDDYGVSRGNLASILDVHPRGLKIERSIVHGIAQDGTRFAIARTLAGLARDLGMELIAKGIETSEDLCAARRAGFELGQGYYLCHPSLAPSRSWIASTGRLLRGTVIESVTSARRRAYPAPPIGDRV